MVLLAEALAEATYLFHCPSVFQGYEEKGGDSSEMSCHCVAFVASEPSKTPVAWPNPEECHYAPGLAGYAELCMVSARFQYRLQSNHSAGMHILYCSSCLCGS